MDFPEFLASKKYIMRPYLKIPNQTKTTPPKKQNKNKKTKQREDHMSPQVEKAT